METVFRTSDVPRAQRIDYWHELMNRSRAPVELSGDDPDRFEACERALRLGSGDEAVTVVTTATSPATVRRTPELVGRSDPEVLYLSLVLRGEVEAVHGDRESRQGPGEWTITDSSRPAALHLAGGSGLLESVGIVIPKRLLSVPRDQLDGTVWPPLSGREGIGGMLAGALTNLTANPGACRPSDGARVAAVLAQLVSALLAHALETADDASLDARRRVLLMRTHEFIDRHLRDPELSPAAVAAAHHISVSYLHRLFSAEGVTVAAWIRLRRLERARLALADPALRAVPVHRVAAAWGFTHHSAFTRAFHDAFGLSPSDYRHQALDAPA
ncbi:transcriptional regulator [Actinomadura cremea]|nr:transcriptional regulator [Actinomadura cremea]